MKIPKPAKRERASKRDRALAYINNSCMVRRYIFAAKVIKNEVFFLSSAAARKSRAWVDRSALHLHAPSAVGARDKFMCFPWGIHYTQLMLWLILHGSFCVCWCAAQSQMENYYYYNDVAIIVHGMAAKLLSRMKIHRRKLICRFHRATRAHPQSYFSRWLSSLIYWFFIKNFPCEESHCADCGNFHELMAWATPRTQS